MRSSLGSGRIVRCAGRGRTAASSHQRPSGIESRLKGSRSSDGIVRCARSSAETRTGGEPDPPRSHLMLAQVQMPYHVRESPAADVGVRRQSKQVHGRVGARGRSRMLRVACRYSKEFEDSFIEMVRHRFGQKRVNVHPHCSIMGRLRWGCRPIKCTRSTFLIVTTST